MRACLENLEMGLAGFGEAVHPFCSHLIVLILGHLNFICSWEKEEGSKRI